MITKFKIFEKIKIPINQNWKIEMINKSIDKINRYKETITYRKSPLFINNLLLNSKLGINYRKYYNLNGEKINKLPVPKEIYKHEQLIKNIKSLIGESNKLKQSKYKNNANLIDAQLKQLIELIIAYSYFPESLDYPDKGFKQNFNTTFFEEMYNLFDGKKTIKEIFNDIYKKDGLINHALFFSNSDNDIRSIFNLIDDFERTIKSYDLIQKRYKKYYKNHIATEKTQNFKLEAFNDFLKKWKLFIKNYYGKISINNNTQMIFTGDFDKDIKNYDN